MILMIHCACQQSRLQGGEGKTESSALDAYSVLLGCSENKLLKRENLLLDAGATRISISIKEGGSKFLQIQDNGHGIQVITHFLSTWAFLLLRMAG